MRLVLGGNQWPAQADVHDAAQHAPARRTGHRRAHADVPAHQGSRHRRLVEFRGQEAHQDVQAASARRRRRHVADAAGRHRSRPGISQVHRVLSLSGRLPRPARSPQARRASSARAFSSTRPRWRCTRSTPRIASKELKDEFGIGYCNITKCCTKVCPEHITITDNAIIPLKERVVDRFYDPVSKLFRMIRGR